MSNWCFTHIYKVGESTYVDFLILDRRGNELEIVTTISDLAAKEAKTLYTNYHCYFVSDPFYTFAEIAEVMRELNYPVWHQYRKYFKPEEVEIEPVHNMKLVRAYAELYLKYCKRDGVCIT